MFICEGVESGRDHLIKREMSSGAWVRSSTVCFWAARVKVASEIVLGWVRRPCPRGEVGVFGGLGAAGGGGGLDGDVDVGYEEGFRGEGGVAGDEVPGLGDAFWGGDGGVVVAGWDGDAVWVEEARPGVGVDSREEIVVRFEGVDDVELEGGGL